MPTPMPSNEIIDACARNGMAWREKQVEMDARAYVRARHLKNIIAVWPSEVEDTSIPGTRHVIARLLKVARAYARVPEHHYHLSRHIAILGALRAEKAQLAHLQNCAGLARIIGAAA